MAAPLSFLTCLGVLDAQIKVGGKGSPALLVFRGERESALYSLSLPFPYHTRIPINFSSPVFIDFYALHSLHYSLKPAPYIFKTP